MACEIKVVTENDLGNGLEIVDQKVVVNLGDNLSFAPDGSIDVDLPATTVTNSVVGTNLTTNVNGVEGSVDLGDAIKEGETLTVLSSEVVDGVFKLKYTDEDGTVTNIDLPNEVLSFDTATFPTEGEENKLYINTETNVLSYWNGVEFIPFGGGNPQVLFLDSIVKPVTEDGVLDLIYVDKTNSQAYVWNPNAPRVDSLGYPVLDGDGNPVYGDLVRLDNEKEIEFADSIENNGAKIGVEGILYINKTNKKSYIWDPYVPMVDGDGNPVTDIDGNPINGSFIRIDNEEAGEVVEPKIYVVFGDYGNEFEFIPTNPEEPIQQSGVIYVDQLTQKTYFWDGSMYKRLDNEDVVKSVVVGSYISETEFTPTNPSDQVGIEGVIYVDDASKKSYIFSAGSYVRIDEETFTQTVVFGQYDGTDFTPTNSGDPVGEEGVLYVDNINFKSYVVEAGSYIRIDEEPELVEIDTLQTVCDRGNETTTEVKIYNSLLVGDEANDISGEHSFAQGSAATASGDNSFAQGLGVTASGDNSFAQGAGNTANGISSHAQGDSTVANGDYSHAEGSFTQANGSHSHAEGSSTIAEGDFSHAEGSLAKANGQGSHAEGISTESNGEGSHAEGELTKATGKGSHAEGNISESIGSYSHAEGISTIAEGLASHAEGATTKAIGGNSHAEGINTESRGNGSHAEGDGTIAEGEGSHAEGETTTATGDYSHAEGLDSESIGLHSHAEGSVTKAIGQSSHAEGSLTEAVGPNSHAEGVQTKAIGEGSHAEGGDTIANGDFQHVQGQFNQPNTNSGEFHHGNGTDDVNRHNLFRLGGASGGVRDDTMYLDGKMNLLAQPFTPANALTPAGFYNVTLNIGGVATQVGLPYYI
jgi:hypothetical protein